MNDCSICCSENVNRWGIWSCGHAACWECALRVGHKCGMCRADSKNIIIQEGKQTLPSSQESLIPVQGWDGVLTTGQKIAADISNLKSLKCKKCNWKGDDAASYIKHLRAEHNLVLCKVCHEGRPQVFIHEHLLYSPDDIATHESLSAQHPKDPSNFKGHPICRFCKYKAYDYSALYNHSCESHLSCLLCDGSASNNTQAMLIYKSYDKLAEHIRRHHFYCEECLSTKTDKHPSSAAFRSKIDLDIHISKTHKRTLSRSSKQQFVTKDDPIPYTVPDDSIFTIIYSTGPSSNPKYEYFQLDENSHNGNDAAEDDEEDQPEVVMSIKPKYAIGFECDGMKICFDPTHNNNGIRCYVSNVEASSVVRTIVDEGDGNYKFKEIRKRLHIPPNQRSVITKLKELAKSCRVSFELSPKLKQRQQEQQQQQQQQQKQATEVKQPVRKEEKKKQFSEMTDDIEEEIGGLTGIYGEDELTGGIVKVDDMTWQVRITIPHPGNSSKETSVLVTFWYPIGFPEIPPAFEFTTDSTCGVSSSYSLLSHHLQNSLHTAVLADYICGAGPVVFNCIEHIKDSFEEVLSVLMSSKGSPVTEAPSQEVTEQPAAPEPEPAQLIDIIEGPPLTDRKSKFVAYFAKIQSHADAMQVLRQLRSCKRIASAAHPAIFAYRLTDGDRVREERDDDGESGAADKLLFFLQRAHVLNYIVVVTRWYGGIHLSSDRFKHIITVAKELLQQHGIVSEPGKK